MTTWPAEALRTRNQGKKRARTSRQVAERKKAKKQRRQELCFRTAGTETRWRKGKREKIWRFAWRTIRGRGPLHAHGLRHEQR